MKITRPNIFETNSSSSHSIVVNGSNSLNTLHVNPETKTITIPRQEFGWGFDIHNDAYSKAAYALQSVEEDQSKFNEVKESILEVTGAENIELIEEGHIDHQSKDTFIDNQRDLTLKEWSKEFIFGNYTLTIDNDNH